jgi:hypothetical protein
MLFNCLVHEDTFMGIPVDFIKKKFRKKLAENLLGPRSGSGTGSGRFRKSDPDPIKNRPDPQHWMKVR